VRGWHTEWPAELERGDDGEYLTVVHFAGLVLAAGFARAGVVSDRLAVVAAVPDFGHRGGWRVRFAARDFVAAGADIARAAQRLNDAGEKLAGGMTRRVNL